MTQKWQFSQNFGTFFPLKTFLQGPNLVFRRGGTRMRLFQYMVLLAAVLDGALVLMSPAAYVPVSQPSDAISLPVSSNDVATMPTR
jgi:hypothetical protein